MLIKTEIELTTLLNVVYTLFWFKQYLLLIKFNAYIHAYMYKNNFQKPQDLPVSG